VLKKVLFGGESGLSMPANAGLTLLRLFAGVALAAGHGLGKIPPGDGLVNRAGEIGFPVPLFFAWAAAMSEFLGGIFLALGLFTRVSSFFVACVMLTALIGVHSADPFATQEKALLYLFVAMAFLLKGAGDWSIDAALRK
jgi:putative oxidoreductase